MTKLYPLFYAARAEIGLYRVCFKKEMRILIIAGLVLITTNVFACSCGRVGILKGQEGSDFIFAGKVIKVNEITTREKLTGTETEIEYKRYE